MKISRIILSLLFLLFIIIACETDSTGPNKEEEAKDLVTQANAALEIVLYDLINGDEPEGPEDIDFSEPYNLYNQAYSKDPNNLDVNFGLSLCNILMMTHDQQLIDAFDHWEEYLNETSPFEAPLSANSKSNLKMGFPTSKDYFNIPGKTIANTVIGIHKMALVDPPQLSTIQNILQNKMLPKLDFAINALDLIDNNPGFTFNITPRMQGDKNEDNLEIDLTEIYALEVSLNVLRAVVDITVSYDINFASYDSAGIILALSHGSDFLTLRNGGSYLVEAQSSLLTAIDKLEDGIDFLRNETDLQDDDVIKISEEDEAGLDSILAHTDEVREILQSPQVYTEDWDDDESTADEALTIDLSRFFQNPINDFKAKLPAYTVSVGRDTVDYDYYYTYDDTSLSATINIETAGYYQYYRSYDWDKWGNIYDNNYSTIQIPSFDEAFENKKAELLSMAGIEWFSVYINFNDTYEVGEHNISTDMTWNYSGEKPDHAVYYPIITWDADTFEEWIFPDPAFNDILPGMTDSEFKRIFGITAEDWSKELHF